MAKRFSFRLDAVRDMRKRKRDEAARKMAAKAAEVTATQQRVESLSKQLRDAVAVGRVDRTEARVEVAALKVQEYHGRWLHGQILGSMQSLARVEREYEEERVGLAQATAKLKAIEKLRERRWRRYVQEVRREEQAIMDEVAGRVGQRVHGEEAAGR